MKIEKIMSDEAVLEELGRRMARRRLDLQLTQADLSEQAGVAKRTLERIEAGSSAQMSSMIRVLRVLDVMEGVEGLVPDAVPRPMDLLKLNHKTRKRASPSSSRRSDGSDKTWQWGDDA